MVHITLKNSLYSNTEKLSSSLCLKNKENINVMLRKWFRTIRLGDRRQHRSYKCKTSYFDHEKVTCLVRVFHLICLFVQENAYPCLTTLTIAYLKFLTKITFLDM